MPYANCLQFDYSQIPRTLCFTFHFKFCTWEVASSLPISSMLEIWQGLKELALQIYGMYKFNHLISLREFICEWCLDLICLYVDNYHWIFFLISRKSLSKLVWPSSSHNSENMTQNPSWTPLWLLESCDPQQQGAEVGSGSKSHRVKAF